MASLIVAGSTGAIGRSVVAHALRQPNIAKVIALTRAKDVKRGDYETVFGLKGPLSAAQNDKSNTGAGDGACAEAADGATAAAATEWEGQLAKLQPVTMDWESFATFWTKYSAHCASSAAAAALPESLQTELTHYQAIFSGHTFAAMCMGTTRSDAGGAKGFIRCDYDYVLTFVEAVLAFSAPGGFPVPRQCTADAKATAPTDGLIYHIGDATEKSKSASGQPSAEAITRAAALSSHTLQYLHQVSAYNAKASSWLLYMKTKGSADDAVAERVRQHNTLIAPTVDTVAGGCSPLVYLSYTRPGLLERGDKTRSNEKMGKIFMSAIPVTSCGACIVGEMASHNHGDAKKAEALWAGESEAQPFTAPKKKGTAPSEPFYVFYNDEIKKQAQRLNTGKV